MATPTIGEAIDSHISLACSKDTRADLSPAYIGCNGSMANFTPISLA